jgi:hypothetical protein
VHDDFAERLAAVEARIAAACARAGRERSAVRLVAVAKTVEAARCREAVAAGQRALGENYAQELRDKAREVPGAEWHFIGALQRNKVKYVVGTAALIHTLDSPALLDEIARQADKRGLSQRCLVEVALAGEAQKAGLPEAELPALLAAAAGRPSVRIEGLMCIPPAEGDPRPYFRRLDALCRAHDLPERSMGMSADFELAIEAGATLVRVGTALFGARPTNTTVSRPHER